MPSSIETAQLQLARAYAYIEEQATSEDLDVAQHAAAITLELYAAAAQLASVTGHIDLTTDQPCGSGADAADLLHDAITRLGDPGTSELAGAVRHLAEAHRRLSATGARR